MDERRTEGAHLRRTSTARSDALEFDGEASPVVIELRECDDDVQLVVTKMLAKRRPRFCPVEV
jgi:hypothetical protein